jgi:TRAP-type uncharacterized transport system substrate-binding protein
MKNKEVIYPFQQDKNHIYNQLLNGNFKTFKIGWSELTFELHHNLKENDEKIDGMTDFDGKKIYLEMALSDLTARETVLHEVMHVILETLGLEERLYAVNSITTTNEQLATILPKMFIIAETFNPGLFKTLFSFQ